MAERQFAIKKIEKLEAHELVTALSNYNAHDDIIKIFANKCITGKQLMKLNIATILPWRREIGNANFNKIDRIVRQIQNDPEDFLCKALNVCQKQPPPPQQITKKPETRKPLPHPRPEEQLQLPQPPFTFPTNQISVQNADASNSFSSDGDSFSSSEENAGSDEGEDGNGATYLDLDYEKRVDDHPAIPARPAMKVQVMPSHSQAVKETTVTVKKGIFGHSAAFDFNRKLPEIPSAQKEQKSLYAKENDGGMKVVKQMPTVMKTDVLTSKEPKPNSPIARKSNAFGGNNKEELAGFMNISAREAEGILRGRDSGAYLIRPSKRFNCTLVIKHENSIYHVGIEYDAVKKRFKCNSNCPSQIAEFETLLKLIEYFKRYPLYLLEDKNNSNTTKQVFLREPVHT